jgi:hypothetical protein
MSSYVNTFQYFDARQHFNENDHQKLIVDRFKSLKLPGNISDIVKVVESFYLDRNAREAAINKINNILKYILPGDEIKIFVLISNCIIEKAKKEKSQLSVIELSQILTLVFWNFPFQDKFCGNI